jgi:LacI family transcriptional regulator, repressor for deo operon, udp, cdd, tsx, nupC, and nupG
MTSIQEVALSAGVSAATVSRALAGKPGVSDRVRAKVVQIASDLDYSISKSAASLTTGRTLTIGLITPDVSRWYFGHLVAAIEKKLSEAGYDILLYDIGSGESRGRFFAKMPLRKRVDAVVALLIPNDHEATVLQSLRVPVAILGASRPGFASLGANDVLTAATAVRHLINLGHQKIGMIGAGNTPEDLVSPRERRAGYLLALSEAGIDFDPQLEQNGDYTALGGERAMDLLLAAPTRPTAVFAQSDEMAIGAMKSIRRHGLSIPTDISIIGIDDHELSDAVGLTTLAQPLADHGSEIARAILGQLSEPGVEVPRIELPTRLIVRETTGPAKP